MTQQDNDNVLQAAMELLNENGFEAYAQVLRILLDQAMKIEQAHALNAGPYERTEARRDYANGYGIYPAQGSSAIYANDQHAGTAERRN